MTTTEPLTVELPCCPVCNRVGKLPATITRKDWCNGGAGSVDCGVKTSYTGRGPTGASERCPTCARKATVVWTRDVIVDRIREWADLYGEPPAAMDWNPWMISSERRKVAFEKFRSGDWPHVSTCQEVFGSWNAAVEAAGLAPRESGMRGPDRPETQVVAA